MAVNFCGECGAKIKSPDAKACTKCGSDPSKTTGFCTSCGTAKASPNAVMCTSCGSTLTRMGTEKDPGVAALIAVLGMFLLAAPAIGYIYLGNVRKGIIYIIASWVLAMVLVGLIFFGSVFLTFIIAFTMGLGTPLLCCIFPFALIPLIFDLVVVYDVYLEAKGEPTKLPSF